MRCEGFDRIPVCIFTDARDILLDPCSVAMPQHVPLSLSIPLNVKCLILTKHVILPGIQV